MQVIFLIRQDDRKSLRMKSTAKQEQLHPQKCVWILAPWGPQQILMFAIEVVGQPWKDGYEEK